MAIKWYGKQYRRELMKGVEKNIATAAAYMERDIKQAFPPSGPKGTRSGGGDTGNPSKKGGIPHVQTGALKGSIGFIRVNSMLYRVGSGIGGVKDPGYAYFLEFGTSNMPGGRPYLRPAIKRNRGYLRKTIGKRVNVRRVGIKGSKGGDA